MKPEEPIKKSPYRLSVEARAELADIATDYSMQYGISYKDGHKAACRRNPELIKKFENAFPDYRPHWDRRDPRVSKE